MTDSRNLALVRSIFDAWERDDFSRTDWASPEIEFGWGDGPDPQTWAGVAGMAEAWLAFRRSWERLDFEGTEFRELDGAHVLVGTRFVGRTRGSELELGQVPTHQACLFEIRDGRVARLILYWHAEQALADLGLTG
jgi:ketosteroid isomerase-like protein